MNKVLELQHVNKTYGQDLKNQVLFDINIFFEEGSFNSIIGQSGSGKSTLLNILGTLDQATSGNVLIEDKNIKDMSAGQLADFRNRTIGFVFQSHYLLPEFTALENVLMPFRISNHQVTKEVIQRAEELLELVDLKKVKNNMATKLSGGQQQRVAIARALMNNPKIILADEPTGNLDSQSTENIYQLLRQVNETFQTTFIIVTHDRRIAEKTDRIIEIMDGRIHMDIKR